MPGYHISKSPFAFLDQRFDGTNVGNYTAALTAIAGGLLAAANARFPGNPPKVQHFHDHWLGGPGPWMQEEPEETLKEGLTAAIKTALGVSPTQPLPTPPPTTAKPMEFFWICAREHSFHVYFFNGPRQVSVFIFTPPPVDPIPVATMTGWNGENLFVVKKEDWESNPPGSNYPGPVTTLPPGSTTSDIIFREIFGGP
jgi:hypothetical protein